MLPSPTEMLVRRALLLTHMILRFVIVSSPATPLLPFVSSTWSCQQMQLCCQFRQLLCDMCQDAAAHAVGILHLQCKLSSAIAAQQQTAASSIIRLKTCKGNRRAPFSRM